MSIWTFLGAGVASATALWIAYRAYPAQKEQDRKLEILKLKTTAYQDYLSALCDDIGYHADQAYAGDQSLGKRQRYEVARFRAVATTYASPEALEQIQAIANSREPNKPLEDYINEIAKFALLVRNECFEDSRLTEEQLREFLPFALKEMRAYD
jgi:hypothetical protein